MDVDRQRATLTERLTNLRAEKRHVEFRVEQGKKITIHHLRAYLLADKKIEVYERQLNALRYPAPTAVGYVQVERRSS